MIGLVLALLGLEKTFGVMGQSSGPMTGMNICSLGRIVAVLEPASGTVAPVDEYGQVVGSPTGACRCDIKAFLSCTDLPAKGTLPELQPHAPLTCSSSLSCP